MTPPIHIREAGPHDTEEVSRVLRLAFAKYEPLYTAQGFAATTPNSEEVSTRLREGPIWVAIHHETIVGTAGAVCKSSQCYVRGVAVLPEWRACGIASLLMATIECFAVVNKAGSLFLTTTPFLDDAIRLYSRLGFVLGNEHPQDLYGTPLLGMRKYLKSEGQSKNTSHL